MLGGMVIRRLDVLFTAAMVAATVIVDGVHTRPLDELGLLLVAAAAAATAGGRRAPLAGMTGAVLFVNAYLLAGYPYGPVLLCLVIAVFQVARQRPLKVSALACGLAAVASSACILLRLLGDQHAGGLLALAWTGWIVLPWSLGALANVLAASRRQLIARTALEERARLAGEVHDIAGHAFALITMQAGVAELVFDEQPEQARRSLQAVSETSAAALADLRRMLDTIHPRPNRLADLIDQVRAGGLPVTVDGLDAVPAPLDAAVYRVVQEALTNVLRHAGPTSAQVSVDRGGGQVRVRITDRGTGAAGPPGRGLAGMRRRIEDLDGRLETGPRSGGGFQVVAWIPEPTP